MSTAHVIEQFYSSLIHGKDISPLVTTNFQWHSSYPMEAAFSVTTMQAQFWEPLKTALPDIERRVYISVSQPVKEGLWSCQTGYFVGTFAHDLLGIPASGYSLYLRYTQMIEVVDGKVSQGYIMIDWLDAMDQLGVNPLRNSLGKPGTVLPPAIGPQILESDAQSDKEGARSLQLVDDMLTELGRFDGQSLSSMNLEKFWHPDFMWYGPAGIGTTRGISGFRQHHQGPFVFSFPDRSVDQGLAFVASGNFAATGGWPHMSGTHTGDACWLGVPATGKAISLRVMDIWRREGELLVENWVAIDIPHILSQLGLDVFAQMSSTCYRK